MKKLLLSAMCAVALTSCNKPAAKTPASATEAPVEFADAKYTEIGKKYVNDLAKGNMEGCSAAFADNAKYYWNNGDSIVGKPAIDKFWKDRRLNVIETLAFENDIWMPIQVNKPQQMEKAGVWLLEWSKVTAKYKGGGKMTQWMHLAYHFNEQGKIDEINHYLDRAPISNAITKK